MEKDNLNNTIKFIMIAILASGILFTIFLAYYFIAYPKDGTELRLWSINSRVGKFKSSEDNLENGSSSSRDDIENSGTSSSHDIIYVIKLDSQGATNDGTKKIYENYAKGIYLNKACSEEYEMGNEATENPITIPSKTGYKFEGYFTQKDGKGIKLIDSDGSKNDNFKAIYFTSNSTLYAKWTELTWDICYGYDGESITTETIKISNIGDTNVPSNIAPTGYEISTYAFLGQDGNANSINYTTKDEFANTIMNKCPNGGMVNVELYSTLIEYTITYNLNGGIVNTANPTTYNIQTETFTLNNPVLDGYAFFGWVESDESTPQTSMSITKGSTGNKTFTAIWGYYEDDGKYGSVYTIKHETNGGTIIDDKILYTGQGPASFGEIPIPSRENYEFLGWYQDSSFKQKITKYSEITGLSGTNSIKTIYAQWKPVDYTITYDLQGGTENKTNPKTYNVETETFILNNPTREGYIFSGWTGSNGETPQSGINISKGSVGAKTYIANWSPVQYEIIYSLDGGTAENLTTYTIETETFILNNPTREGYVFAGWVGSNGVTPQINVNVEKGSVEDRKYIAKWTPIEYQIAYNLDGGTAENLTTYTIETETFILNNPTKDGYTFLGWTGSNGTTPQTTVSIAKGSTRDKTYIANWTKIVEEDEVTEYTISYDLNGGTLSKENPAKYTKETETFTLNNPIKEGYTFLGWTGSNGTTAQTTVSIVKGSTGNKSYVANWSKKTDSDSGTEKKYTIKLQTNEGTTMEDISFDDISTLGELPIPTREGYKFEGWYKESTFKTKITKFSDIEISENEEVTIYAKWEKISTNEEDKKNQIGSNNNNNDKNENKVTNTTNYDDTTKKTTLPKTGLTIPFIPMILVVIIVGVMFYRKFNYLKDVK